MDNLNKLVSYDQYLIYSLLTNYIYSFNNITHMSRMNEQIRSIIGTDNLVEDKIDALEKLYHEEIKNENSDDLLPGDNILQIELAIEDIVCGMIRISAEMDSMEDRKEILKRLYVIVEDTLQWNSQKKESLYGVVERASMRAMLKDPEVSDKEKAEIRQIWADYL